MKKSGATTNQEIIYMDSKRHVEETYTSNTLKYLSALYNNTRDIVCVFDKNGIVLDCNIKLLQLNNVSDKREIVGQPITRFLPQSQQQVFNKDLSLFLSGKKLTNEIREIIDGEGNHRYIELNVKPIYKENFEIDFILSMFRDVTTEVVSNKNLENQLTALEATSDSFWIWDLKDNHTRNKSLEQVLGFKPEELEDTVSNWFKLMHPLDRKKVERGIARHIESKGKIPYQVEIRYKNSKGGITYLLTRGKVVEWSSDGTPLKMIGTETDITATKVLNKVQEELIRQNETFEHVLESTMAGYWDWNIKDNIQYLSPTFKAMFGYKDHEMKNAVESWHKIVHPDDLPKLINLYNEHIRTKGKVPYNIQTRFFHKNGSVIWVLSNGKVIEWDKEGNPIRMVGSNIDITNLINLAKSNEDLERFAYLASHDLQEPLRTIKDFIQIFKEEYGSKIGVDGKSYLEFIENSSERMTQLITGLLDYSKVGKTSHKETVDLNRVLKNVLKDLNTSIKQKNAIVKTIGLPNVIGNEIELHSLFLNLIGNSLKFTTKEQIPHINITKGLHKGMLKINISDNGIGIPKDKLNTVFEIFKRLNNSQEFSGTGIGLSQCKKIVETHNGEIWCESEQGKGTTFSFTLQTA